MNEELRKQCAYIRTLTSAEAAAWILEKYPPTVSGGEIFPIIIGHRSWKKREQRLLANSYITQAPFPSSFFYEIFLKFMSVPRFVEVIKRKLPADPSKIDLLIYTLKPALINNQKTNRDADIIREFIAELKSMIGNETLWN